MGSLYLRAEDRRLLSGEAGPGAQMAMRIVAETARMLGAPALTDIASAHIDGCLYHGDSGVHFAERLLAGGSEVSVPTTLNVGALDLIHARRERLGADKRAMAARLMSAYVALGCKPTWTCAPYQAGHRPKKGENVAWGESNAVAFCNSVLGARTNRYGDFLDICAAITGRAPLTGLHVEANRRATLLVDLRGLPDSAWREEIVYPILGSWLGKVAGSAVAAFLGMPKDVREDDLKALGAAAASSGAVGLFHVIGVTPEAPTLDEAFGGVEPEHILRPAQADLRAARASLSTVTLSSGNAVDAVAVGSPHLSIDECRRLLALLKGRKSKLPFYACTGRHVLAALEAQGLDKALAESNVTVVVDTCIVVTPILSPVGGVLMTNSGKFAHYTPANTGYEVVFATLADCVETAICGRWM